MAASADERRFMDRIGQYKQASHALAADRHLGQPLVDRLQRSWDMYLTHRSASTVGNRRDDPSPFYARARRLGLYLSQT